MTVYVSATWIAREGKENEVSALLPTIASASEREAGCVSYKAVRAVDDPRRFVLFETYADEAALDEHRHSEHFQDLVLGRVVPLLERREVAVCTDL
jgi:quinol monooxygenase YgiN